MEDIKHLQNLAVQVDKILKEELRKSNIEYSLAEARIYDCKTVGVKGDQRVYGYSAEIELNYNEVPIWKNEFLANLSTRITNEIEDLVRVVYVFGKPNK